MTSVLNVDEIAAKNGTDPVVLTKQSAAKAWVTFDHTTTVQDSFSVSSLADNGTGDTSQTLSNAMSNTNYGCQVTTGRDTGSGARSYPTLMSDGKSTTVQRYQNIDGRSTSSPPSRLDNNFTVASVFGDLA